MTLGKHLEIPAGDGLTSSPISRKYVWPALLNLDSLGTHYSLQSETYHVNVNETAQRELSIYPDITVHGHDGPVAVSYPVHLPPIW